MFDVVNELTRITHAASLESSLEKQVNIIVDEVSRCLDIDVCSLYRLDSHGDMELLASHGLSVNRPLKIPKGEGLVGLVVKNRHTINVDNGTEHPAYFHVNDISEENFLSFCGAPMICNGETIGVLVAQSQQAVKLDDKQEAFFTTIASHIALIVKHLPKKLTQAKKLSSLKGIAASEGVSMGNPILCSQKRLADVALSYQDEIDAELARLAQLIKDVAKELDREIELLGESISSEIRDMFDAYKMLLFDQTFHDKVSAGIKQKLSLPSALKQAVQHFSDLFMQMDNDYLRARAEDIWHIGNKIYHAYNGSGAQDMVISGGEDIILIGHEISVSDVAAYQSKHLKGIVCAGGARLSHTAIIANALGIPAVMGVEGLLEFSDAKTLIVDGTEGIVHFNPSKLVLGEYKDLIERQAELEKSLGQLKNELATTENGKRIQLFANSGLISDLSPGIRHGAEGVGLYRTEIAFMMRDSFPTEDEQFELYQSVFSKYPDKPVYMRTLDIGGDKQLPYFPIEGEDNPAMGWRGVRFTLDNTNILMTQLRAMLKAASISSDLKIIVPMVSSIEELVEFEGILSEAINQLTEEGVTTRRPEIGVMIEVPAAISQLKFWLPYIDFVSIGTNDLSQYVLALDRNNPKVASRFDLVHPAVINEVYRAVSEAKKLKLPICVCGEMASDPIALLLLIAMGVEKFSVSSSKIPRMKALIKQVDEACLNVFLDQCLEQSSAPKIKRLGQSFIDKLSIIK